MTQTQPAVMDFLLARRSHPARTLALPVPDRAALAPILRAGLRTPDHGKLEPWRLMVLARPALERLAGLAAERGAALGLEAARIDKGVRQYAEAHLVVAVIAVPRPHATIPPIEQQLSAGAVCLSLVNAALASGWGAVWLTGWAAHDPVFCARGLDLAEGEFVAGMIHIGTPTTQPGDRPRPDPEATVTWVER
ncbi:nitroreductase family protein [Rhodobaculum claviforme]|uniref:Putative NAD(P)H nitroreductase n=1 Tax=Rhodobaculum claviforme TaxID=1549854 RepID=A0A934WFE0_9RHOB|nr:nitroreductase [Rhodobaculum claviforme]MBK5926655.1 nitroreductase [Rhodobaculum claviforme]